jgi:hypothetical protein
MARQRQPPVGVDPLGPLGVQVCVRLAAEKVVPSVFYFYFWIGGVMAGQFGFVGTAKRTDW